MVLLRNSCIQRISSFAISSSQLVLLKFLDGYLQIPTTAIFSSDPSLPPFLVSLLSILTKSLTADTVGRGREMDGRDAAAVQGVVLAVQCLSSIGLASDEGRRCTIDSVEDTTGTFFLPIFNIFIRPDACLSSSTKMDPYSKRENRTDCRC